MSKYLDKQALLKWLEQRCKENNEEFEVDRFGENMEIINKIKSGAFDVDQTEVQRLRAALHKITQIFDDPNLHDLTACQEMDRVAKEALSTTIEPTNAVKVERFECPYCGCEINAREKFGISLQDGRFDVNELEILIGYIKLFADYLQEITDLVWKIYRKVRLLPEDELKKLIADLRNGR